MKKNNFNNCFFILLIILLSFQAEAVEFDYSVVSSFRHSDNLSGRPGEVGGDALFLGFSFDIESNSNAVWNFSLESNLSFTDFSTSELSQEDTQDLTFNINYDPVDSNFRLLVADNLTQVPRDRFITESVNNLREINAFYIRPTYFVRISPLDYLNLEYTYVDFTNLNSSEDSSILYGTRITQESTLGYEKRISSLSSIGLYQSRVDTKFKEAIDDDVIDFEQTDTFIRWQTSSQYTRFSLEYGVSDVANVRQEKVSSTLKRVSFSRQITRNQLFTLRYQVGFDTVLNSNLATNSINFNSASSDFGTAQEVDEASFIYLLTAPLSSITLNYIDRKLKSAIGRDTEERKELLFTYEYSLSRLINIQAESTVEFFVRLFDNNFDTELSNITESSTEIYGLRYNHPLNRDFVIFSEYSKRNTEDDNPFQDTRVDSYSIEFGFEYSLD